MFCSRMTSWTKLLNKAELIRRLEDKRYSLTIQTNSQSDSKNFTVSLKVVESKVIEVERGGISA